MVLLPALYFLLIFSYGSLLMLSSPSKLNPELKYRTLWLSIGYALIGLVIYLSLTPHIPTPGGIEINDKLSHVLAYAVLMGWFSQLYHRSYYKQIAFLLIIMGISLEFFQSMTGYRYMEFLDVIANSCGVFMGWLLSITPLGRVLKVTNEW